MIKKRARKHFPLDFYGDDKGWRFIIRAYIETEVLEALRWRDYISVHREDFNLFELAVETFPYTKDDVTSIAQIQFREGARIKMMGPVVEVRMLNQLYQWIKK